MRNEYPRPDFVRKNWMNLNGFWSFTYGECHTKIQVPFVCQSERSGIGERIKENHVVYERTFSIPTSWRGKHILLNFGAVDYSCQIFINGSCAGSHVGGQTSFSLDITRYLNWDQESIRVEVEDPLYNECIPRGKQFWEDQSRFIWYTPSTGIWQTVWLEPVSETRFQWIHFTPDIDQGTVQIEYELSESSQLPVSVQTLITLENNTVFSGTMLCSSLRNTITVDIFHKKALAGAFHFTGNYWSPEHPILYDVSMSVGNEILYDQITTYFGMRKIHIEGGKLYLNNQPYYHKLVLDQGYWKESLITAPSDEDFCNDILKCKAMGFNGCRKHEKAEDPRFLYWADKLGFLVWEGMASFWSYTPEGAAAFTREWLDLIKRDYNHPSIVVWGMLNESWGVTKIYKNQQQQNFCKCLYHLAKAMDTTRLVISNDGWEMTDSDICAFHSYKHGERNDLKQHEFFQNCLKNVDTLPLIMEKLLFAEGTEYKGQPVVLTECGGISVKSALSPEVCRQDAIEVSNQDWGYTSATSEDFIKEYSRIINAVYESPIINGFCYTQLTDVEQEMNGLLDQNHNYKFNPEDIKAINDKKTNC